MAMAASASNSAAGWWPKAAFPGPPEGGWGWVVVFASFIAHLLIPGSVYTFGVVYSALLSDPAFGGVSGITSDAKRSETAWIGSMATGIMFGCGIVTGHLVSRYGARPVVIGGGLLIAAGMLGSSAVEGDMRLLYLTYGVVAGIGFGCAWIPSVMIVSRYFVKRRALATGIAVSGAGVGTLILGPLTQALIDSFGWRGCMRAIGIAMAILLSACGATYEPVHDANHQPRPHAQQQHAQGEPEATQSPGVRADSLAEDPAKSPQHSSSRQHLVVSVSLVRGPGTAPGIVNDDGAERPAAAAHDIGNDAAAADCNDAIDIAMATPVVLAAASIVADAPSSSSPPSSATAAVAEAAAAGSVAGTHASSAAGTSDSTAPSNPAASQHAPSSTLLQPYGRLTILQVWTTRPFVVMAVVLAVYGGCLFVPYSHIVVYCSDLGLDKGASSRALAVMGIFSTIGRIVFGRMSDHSRQRQHQNHQQHLREQQQEKRGSDNGDANGAPSRRYVHSACRWLARCLEYSCCRWTQLGLLQLSLCAAGLATLLLAWAGPGPPGASQSQREAAVIVFGCIYGSFAGSVMAMAPPIMAEYLGLHNLPHAVGGINTAQMAFVVGGAPLAGWMRGALGSYQYVWVAFGCAMASAPVLLNLMPELRQHQHAPQLQKTQPQR